MTVQVSPSQATDLIIHSFKSKIVTMIHGSPSTAKSSIIHQIAKRAILEVIDIRLSQFDPVFLLGLPDVQKENYIAKLIPFDIFPTENTPLPKNKNGWIIFLDEFNSCNRSVQAAAYKLVLDRMIGQVKLHPKARIVLAGNLASDNAIVNDMSTAMQSRLAHIEVKMTKEDWVNWAIDNDIDSRIITFIENRPSLLMNFDPEHNDKTFPSPRGWGYMVNNIIKNQVFDRWLLPLVQGAVGEGAGLEFYNFCQIRNNLPSVNNIINNPLGTPIPDKPAHKYALSSMLVEVITVKNAKQLMLYIDRLPMEYTYLVIRMAVKFKPEILNDASIDQWVTTNANRFYN